MQPSSLIFLVVIGVWAAFFVQYWVRRREHVATARSMDRFSDAMRVLDHAVAVAAADEPVHASHGAAPLVATHPPAASAHQQHLAREARATLSARARAHAGPAGAEPGRARGVVLLLSFVATVVVAGLVGFDLLVWWAPAVPVAATVGSFLWVRQGVRSVQAARLQSARGARHRAAPHPHARPNAEPAGRTAAQPARSSRPGEYAAPEGASAVSADRPAGRRKSDEPYDLSLVEPPPPDVVRSSVVASSLVAPSTVSRPATQQTAAWREPVPATSPRGPATLAELMADDDDIPLTWDPVPVPRPTYTMKARVDRRMPEPAETVADPLAEGPAEADGADAAYPQGGDRRVAGA